MEPKQHIPSEQILLIVILVAAILGIVVMLSACAWMRDAADGAKTVGRTIKAIDSDGSGDITFQEIIGYMVGGYFSGRTVESGCRYGAKKFKHGGHSIGETSCETGIVSRNRQCGDQALEN